MGRVLDKRLHVYLRISDILNINFVIGLYLILFHHVYSCNCFSHLGLPSYFECKLFECECVILSKH